LRRWEIADALGYFGESAMTRRFEYLAFAVVAAQGNKDASKVAAKLQKELDR